MVRTSFGNMRTHYHTNIFYSLILQRKDLMPVLYGHPVYCVCILGEMEHPLFYFTLLFYVISLYGI